MIETDKELNKELNIDSFSNSDIELKNSGSKQFLMKSLIKTQIDIKDKPSEDSIQETRLNGNLHSKQETKETKNQDKALVYLRAQDNYEKCNASNCIYFHGGSINFFHYQRKKLIGIPFDLKFKIDSGYISPSNPRHLDIFKNMLECYPSYVSCDYDFITNEPMTLRLYRVMELTISHNVFTSIIYCIPVVLGKNRDIIIEIITKLLKFSTLDIINTNYYLRFNSEPECRRLALIETKIYFWWHISQRDQKIDDDVFFIFYLWCFRNIFKLDNPEGFGRIIQTDTVYSKYFSLINNCDKLHELFILRYGPKYLSKEELINDPEKIFDLFDVAKCKSNLEKCILKNNGIC
uniref:Uncharacterized protein n=1 Tax=viral metagenome TaxID=1070528 RepID=A0A6C0BCP1_9ZZZZ